jgi:ubiquinone biosynthesis protein
MRSSGASPQKLRLILEDLGPTFVKIGQILSMRADLLPEAFLTELAQLRDSVRPMPFPEVRGDPGGRLWDFPGGGLFLL